MKFTDGNWMMRKGVKAHYPAEAYEQVWQDGQLTVSAPARFVRHRGDTLDGPMLDITFFTPAPDVVGVRISHFEEQGSQYPEFPILRQHTNPQWEDEEEVSVFRSGRLEARIHKKNWSVEFAAEGKILTKSGPRGMAYAQVEGEGSYIHEQLGLGVGEYVYGLGERFAAFVKNGQTVDIWNRDGGTGSDQAYKNVPFYLTNRGYAVFVNHPGDVSFEVATEKVSRVQFSVAGETLEYLVIYGPTPREALQKYTALTGLPALPPAWSFGLWLTTSFTTPYDEQTVTSFIQGMADHDLPLHVFHFDCFWMREFHWCDFQWDPRTFPDPAAMLSRLKERGLKICVWINPYIAHRSVLFAEGKNKGFLLKRRDGSVWQTDQWQAGMGIVDFTNPTAVQWFAGHLQELARMGVDSFKTDFGERIPTEDVQWFDGSCPERMHNYYPYLYNKTVFEALAEVRGRSEAVLFARSATAGCQQFPVHWGGDCYSSFESMAESLRGGLSLCLSGFGFWSHDIGGFEGTPPSDVYKRWIAFGMLSSHSRLHGSSSYRVPWLFDEEAVEVLRTFTRLKCKLMPTLYGAAVEAAATGMPVMRAMLLEFPDDISCQTADRQYMLGSSLLAAPVFTESGEVDFYLPEGKWTHLLTGHEREGPGWVKETHGFLSLPLYVRPNSLLATGSRHDTPDYEFAENVLLEAFALQEGAGTGIVVPDRTGQPALTAQLTKEGSEVIIRVETHCRGWQVLLHGVQAARAEGAVLEKEGTGTRVKPSAYTAGITEIRVWLLNHL